ncbi:hypothetical protein HJFPF1_07389 [Paramyrothecium foliicola]|nr:hypothetical protein HJFPF1_07389 [Paramyrothecium foliicola]
MMPSAPQPAIPRSTADHHETYDAPSKVWDLIYEFADHKTRITLTMTTRGLRRHFMPRLFRSVRFASDEAPVHFPVILAYFRSAHFGLADMPRPCDLAVYARISVPPNVVTFFANYAIDFLHWLSRDPRFSTQWQELDYARRSSTNVELLEYHIVLALRAIPSLRHVSLNLEIPLQNGNAGWGAQRHIKLGFPSLTMSGGIGIVSSFLGRCPNLQHFQYDNKIDHGGISQLASLVPGLTRLSIFVEHRSFMDTSFVPSRGNVELAHILACFWKLEYLVLHTVEYAGIPEPVSGTEVKLLNDIVQDLVKHLKKHISMKRLAFTFDLQDQLAFASPSGLPQSSMGHFKAIANSTTSAVRALDAAQERILSLPRHRATKFDDSVLRTVRDQREAVDQLRDITLNCDKRESNEVPSLVTAEIVAILEAIEQDAIALFDANSEMRPMPTSEQEATLQRLANNYKRVKIAFDILTLCGSGLLGDTTSASQQEPATKADIVMSIAQMRGLFDRGEKPNATGHDLLQPPPAYDEVVRGGAAQQKDAPQLANPTIPPKDNKEPPADEQVAHTNSAKKLSGGASSSTLNDRHHSLVVSAMKLKPQQVAIFSPDAGEIILTTECFGREGAARVAVATPTKLRVYNALTGLLLWELYGSSPSLVKSRGEAPMRFTKSLRPSPDGSRICARVQRGSLPQLIILDARNGQLVMMHTLNNYHGRVVYTSFDNTMVCLFQWAMNHESTSFMRVMSSEEGKGTFGLLKLIPFHLVQGQRGIVMSFAPDNRHIITCEGPAIEDLTTDFSVTVRTYRISDSKMVYEHSRLSSRSGPNNLVKQRGHSARFHFPSQDQWLVCFPDYDEPCKTCIMDVKTGAAVAWLSAELSGLLAWQVGALPAALPVQVGMDVDTGVWTRVEQNTSLVPRGRTVTVTRFPPLELQALSGATKGRMKPEATVLKIGSEDECYLSPNGRFLLVQRGVDSRKEDLIRL